MEIIIIAVAAVLFITILALIFAFRGKISAITMRIIQFEGTVSLEEDGKPKTIRNNTRLNGEDEVSTEASSNVKIGLDDYKIVSLEELSRARISKNGRMLELNLESGTLNFEVSKPLDADETMDIKTSTMIVGIRGTAGTVSSIDGKDSVAITEGVVHTIVSNPSTGETKELDVHAGEKITVQLLTDRTTDSIEIIKESFTLNTSEETAHENETDTVEGEADTHNHDELGSEYPEGFKLVEVSDEIRNSVLTDRMVQVGNVILRFDGSMTFGEAIELLKKDNEMFTVYEMSPYEQEVKRDYNGALPRWFTGMRTFNVYGYDTVCGLEIEEPEENNNNDCKVLSVYSPPLNSIDCLNFFYPGNLSACMSTEWLNSAKKGNLVLEIYNNHYKKELEQRKSEYPSSMEFDDFYEYISGLCSKAGLEIYETTNEHDKNCRVFESSRYLYEDDLYDTNNIGLLKIYYWKFTYYTDNKYFTYKKEEDDHREANLHQYELYLAEKYDCDEYKIRIIK